MTGSTSLGPLEVAKFAVNQGLSTFIANGPLVHHFIAYCHRTDLAGHPYQWRAVMRDWHRILTADPEAMPWARV